MASDAIASGPSGRRTVDMLAEASREALAQKLERWAANQPDPKIRAIQLQQAEAARKGDMVGVFGR